MVSTVRKHGGGVVALSLQSLDPRNFTPVQAPDPTKRFKTLADARGMMQQEQLRGQQIQQNEAEMQGQQKAMKDAAAVHDLLAQGFDESGNLRPEAIQGIIAINPEFGRSLWKDEQTRQQSKATGQRAEAVQNATLLEGQPDQEFGTTGMAPTYQAPLPDLQNPNVLEQGTPEGVAPEGQRVVGPQEHPEITVPSAWSGAAMKLRPRTRAGVQNQTEADARRKADEQIRVDRAKQKAEFEFNTTNRAMPTVNNDTVTTSQGVMQFNPATQRYDIKVGDRPPSQSSASGEPLVPVDDGFGNVTYVPRSQAAGAKVPISGANKESTGAQKRVLNFYIRAKDGKTTLDGVELDIGKLGTFEQGKLKFFPNIMQSELGQTYTQAQRAFIEAYLRKDSGAAIPPHEYVEAAKTYFAQPGDTKTTLANKKRGRDAIMEGLKQESGRAYKEHYGEESSGPKASIDDILDKVFGKPK